MSDRDRVSKVHRSITQAILQSAAYHWRLGKGNWGISPDRAVLILQPSLLFLDLLKLNGG